MNHGQCLSIAVLLMLTTPVFGQGEIICCNQLIDVGGSWVTSRRDCIEWMNQSTANRAKVCANPRLSNMVRECASPSANATEPADVLLALLLPAVAHAQAPSSPVGCCADVASLCDDDACKDAPPATGYIYVDAQGDAQLRGEPSNGAPVVGTHPSGHRVPYAQAVRSAGKTWFRVPIASGGGQGWVSGDDIRCKRGDLPRPEPGLLQNFSRAFHDTFVGPFEPSWSVSGTAKDSSDAPGVR